MVRKIHSIHCFGMLFWKMLVGWFQYQPGAGVCDQLCSAVGGTEGGGARTEPGAADDGEGGEEEGEEQDARYQLQEEKDGSAGRSSGD